MQKPTLQPLYWLIAITMACLFMNSSHSAETKAIHAIPQTNLPTQLIRRAPVLTPTPPDINAKATMLIDVDSGKVIAQKRSSVHRPPASLTKMMTLYVISSALKNGQIHLEDKVRISQNAWQTGGSRMFVKHGEFVTVKNLLQGIIVDSGNDACVAMAEHVAGSEKSFAKLMNDTAQSLGMTNSHFTDSTGLPNANHYTTAHDLAILGRALVQNFPDYYGWYKQKWFTYNGIKQPNRNRLLWRDNLVDGIKTGHTSAAGYCLVASATKNHMRLLTIVMGAPSDEARSADSERLLTYGFRFFETEKLYQAGQTIDTPRVWRGKVGAIPVGLAEDLAITIPTGQFKNIKTSFQYEGKLQAPIQKAQTVGNVSVILNGKTIAQRALIALEADPKGGLWTRMTDSVSLAAHRWFGDSEA